MTRRLEPVKASRYLGLFLIVLFLILGASTLAMAFITFDPRHDLLVIAIVAASGILTLAAAGWLLVVWLRARHRPPAPMPVARARRMYLIGAATSGLGGAIMEFSVFFRPPGSNAHYEGVPLLISAAAFLFSWSQVRDRPKE